MAVKMWQEGIFSSAHIQKMFDISLTKTSFLKYEENGSIPKAERIKRGKSNYRAWGINNLPLIGEKLGFMKKPKSPQVISVFSLKGGTGKTSVAFQLARSSALHNIRTLVIGLDAQESITQTLNRTVGRVPDQPEPSGIYQILVEGERWQDTIVETDISSLDFIPETIELSILDHWLKNQKRKEYIIRERVIEPILKSGKYDQIIFDCNPAWSDVVTGALESSNILLSPLGADVNSLKAAKIFVELLDEFQEDMKHHFDDFLIIPTMVENNKLSQNILARYRLSFEDVCSTAAIKRSVAVQEANAQGKSMLEVGFSSPVFQDFISILKEINHSVAFSEDNRDHEILSDSDQTTAEL